MELEDDFGDLEASLPCPDWSEDDEALAYYLATARYGGRSLPVSVREEMERITLAARDDEALARRIASLSRRMDELDGGSVRGIGRLADERPEPVATSRSNSRAPVARAKGRRVTWRKIAVGVPAAVVLLVIGLSVALRPGVADLAEPGPLLEIPPEPHLLRGQSGAEEAAHDQVARAHALLVEARGRGRWIARYDRKSISEAVVLLEDVRTTTSPGDPTHTAATYLLAKAFLAAGDQEAAEGALRAASSGTGPSAAAARELSVRLQDRLRE